MSERAQELRFTFIVHDLEAAIGVFAGAVGLDVLDGFEHGDGRGVVLDVPSATLELFDRAYGDHVDEVEVGRPLGERIRIAVRVASLRRRRSRRRDGMRP